MSKWPYISFIQSAKTGGFVRQPDDATRMIVRDLRDQLTDGRLPDGTPLPTESQLAGRYLVSRRSVRGALQDLAAAGLLLRVPGKGTFAAPSEGGLAAQALTGSP
jgi:GntR family transcriptional regulator